MEAQTRREFLKAAGTTLLGLSAASVLPGYGNQASALAASSATTDSGGLQAPQVVVKQSRTLVISTWGGDTEESIKKFVQEKFEKEHNVKLIYDIGGMGARYNKLLAQRGTSTVDVFFSTDEPVFNGIRHGLFAKLNPANIPNLKNVYDWAKPTDGYGVAYGLITYGLAYHTGSVKVPPKGWADMWRDDLKSAIALCAVSHSMMPAMLIRAAELAGGGPDNIRPGLAKLAQLRPKKLTFFWTDWAPLMKSGDVLLATEFDYYVEGMKDKGYPVEFVLPEDKGFASLEHLSVPANSKNKELAEAFINAMLEPDVQQALAENYYVGPANKQVKVSAKVAARISYGDKVKNIRFFDGKFIDEKRPFWSELLNTQVVPQWS